MARTFIFLSDLNIAGFVYISNYLFSVFILYKKLRLCKKVIRRITGIFDRLRNGHGADVRLHEARIEFALGALNGKRIRRYPGMKTA